MNDLMPTFEGRPVDGSVVKMSGAAPLDDLSDVVLSIDDRVQLLSMFTVVGVRHETNKDGELVRVHILRPVEMSLAPISGTSDGILRALPGASIGSGSAAIDGDDDE